MNWRDASARDLAVGDGVDFRLTEGRSPRAVDVRLAKRSEAPLLPGWEEHWSEEHQRSYYWHKPSKQPGGRGLGGFAYIFEDFEVEGFSMFFSAFQSLFVKLLLQGHVFRSSWDRPALSPARKARKTLERARSDSHL